MNDSQNNEERGLINIHLKRLKQESVYSFKDKTDITSLKQEIILLQEINLWSCTVNNPF